MATFKFETILSNEAQGIGDFDIVTFASSPAAAATAIYGMNNVTITVGARTVEFGQLVSNVSLQGNLEFADGSKLYLGNALGNNITGTLLSDGLFGGAGDDSLNAADGNNLLQGNQGNDTLSAFGGSDTLYGGKDNDILNPGEGANWCQGNIGNDTVTGGSGADVVRGGQDNDSITGGAGNDWLSGDRGSDTLTGGTGADIFHSWNAAGVDRITDFNVAQGDHVLLDAGTIYSLNQAGADAVVDMGGGNQVILVGINLNSLTNTDWISVG
jgi:Ca2+-binding RTX toxin-like protein